MVYLLLGKDDFSKREFFGQLKAAQAVEVSEFDGAGAAAEILRRI